MRKLMGFVFAGLLLATAVAAKADTLFTGNSSGVNYATSTDSGFSVTPYPQYVGTAAVATRFGSDLYVGAQGPDYSDAGIVLYFNGGLTLGELQSVTVNSTGSPLNVNLWLDTGSDGQFFAFDSSDEMTSLNGDSYGGTGSSVNANSPFSMFGGDGAGNTYTLAQLVAGDDLGISASTPVALWIGTTNPGGGNDLADISGIDVVSTPEPSSLMLLGTGFLGLVGVVRRKLA